MPELPEVETIKTSLNNSISGLTIKNVVVNNYSLRSKVDSDLASKLRNKKIIDVNRRAKYLVFNFSDNSHILSHLGMSGNFSFLDCDKCINYQTQKHDHIIINFKNGSCLIYNDPRRFGKFNYYQSSDEIEALLPNGIEPDNPMLNSEFLSKKIQTKTSSIRNILFDQNIIVGLGNIYISEILWLADINPNRKANSLSVKEISKLISSIRKILKKATLQGGSSLKDFKHIDNNTGKFQLEFNAYNKKNQKCLKKNCFDGIIIHQKINQRSSYYCDSHQK